MSLMMHHISYMALLLFCVILLDSANQILDNALSHQMNCIPRALFEVATGLVILTNIEAGFIYSLNMGTGVMFKNLGNGVWSMPSACGLTGVGVGFMAGISVKDMIVFILDETSLPVLEKNAALKLGLQIEVTIGPFGRSFQFNANASEGGIGATIVLSCTRGLFGGVSIDGAVLAVRPKVNEVFYGKSLTNAEILNGTHAPIVSDTVRKTLDDIFDKLKSIEDCLILEAQSSNDKGKNVKPRNLSNLKEESQTAV